MNQAIPLDGTLLGDLHDLKQRWWDGEITKREYHRERKRLEAHMRELERCAAGLDDYAGASDHPAGAFAHETEYGL